MLPSQHSFFVIGDGLNPSLFDIASPSPFVATAAAVSCSTEHTPLLSKKKVPNRFQFDPADKVKEPALKGVVRALMKHPPEFAPSLVHWLDGDGGDIFKSLWPFADATMAPTPETRIVWGVAGLMAGLAARSPRVLDLLMHAPSQPNYEFHIPNALLAIIKLTARPIDAPGLARRAAQHLLTQTLKRVASLAEFMAPDMARPLPDAPFPKFMLLMRSFIDLLACTPRLIVDCFCASAPSLKDEEDEDPSHRYGYRMYGDFRDALRVAPDEEDTLASILEQFEFTVLADAPTHCNKGHAFDRVEHAYSYVGRGPPQMLFFEAMAAQGIPRTCLSRRVVLTEGIVEIDYALIAVVHVLSTPGGSEDDLAIEFYSPEDDGDIEISEEDSLGSIALVVYVRRTATEIEAVVTLRAIANGDTAPIKPEDSIIPEEEDDEEEEEEELPDSIDDS